MVSIARRNLFHDLLRLTISLGGVAFSVFLMLFVFGIYNGFEYALISYVINQDADIWISHSRSLGLFRGGGMIPEVIGDELITLNDVKSVNKLIERSVYDAHKKNSEDNMTIKVVGYNTQTGVGGPWSVIEGKDQVEKGEIIIDMVAAQRHDIRINDKVIIRDKEFTVVGISELTNIFLLQYVFIDYQDAVEIFNAEGLATFILIKIRNPEFVYSVIDNIKEMYDVNALSKLEFMEENRELIRQGFIAIFIAILALGIIVGTTFVALTIYTLTVEKIKEYGILKALGATNSQLYKIIFEQSLTISLLSYAIGSAFVVLVFSVSRLVVPELASVMAINSFFYVLGASILISVLASYIPIRKVSKIDPLIIFR